MRHSYLAPIFNRCYPAQHVSPDSIRTRKLLLNRREIEKLMGAVNQKAMPACHYPAIGKTRW